jgi:hypothetical protein
LIPFATSEGEGYQGAGLRKLIAVIIKSLWT